MRSWLINTRAAFIVHSWAFFKAHIRGKRRIIYGYSFPIMARADAHDKAFSIIIRRIRVIDRLKSVIFDRETDLPNGVCCAVYIYPPLHSQHRQDALQFVRQNTITLLRMSQGCGASRRNSSTAKCFVSICVIRAKTWSKNLTASTSSEITIFRVN